MPNLSPSCPLLARARTSHMHTRCSRPAGWPRCIMRGSRSVARAATNATHEHDAADQQTAASCFSARAPRRLLRRCRRRARCDAADQRSVASCFACTVALLAPMPRAPFSCAFARAAAAATVASRAIARAAAAATVALHAARAIDCAIDRAIDRGCSGSRDRLHPASPRRCSPTAPSPTLRPLLFHTR
jgi:hypothetical protein